MDKPCYKARVQSSPGWNLPSRAFISISQGQECHQGTKLDALLEWSFKSYDTCMLNISDTLHRHNLINTGMNEAEAFQKSLMLGDEWLQRNDEVLKKYMARFEAVHRWNDWLNHPDFANLHKDVLNFFDSEPAFRKAALADVQTFSRRKAEREKTAPALFVKTSLDYLLEEIAAYIIISRQYTPSRVYPAKPLQSFTYLEKAIDIPANLKGMEKGVYARVVFTRLEAKNTARSVA